MWARRFSSRLMAVSTGIGAKGIVAAGWEWPEKGVGTGQQNPVDFPEKAYHARDVSGQVFVCTGYAVRGLAAQTSEPGYSRGSATGQGPHIQFLDRKQQ